MVADRTYRYNKDKCNKRKTFVERKRKRERERWFWDIIHGLPIIHSKN